MSAPEDNDPFYIGYLPKAPTASAKFMRKSVATIAVAAIAIGAAAAIALPYFGHGEFDWGRPREFRGTLRCAIAPRLETSKSDFLLVGAGKHAVAPEICGVNGNDVSLRGTLIRRDGRQLLEIESSTEMNAAPTAPDSPPVPLGRFTLQGEIVDSKCYFGVMNPAEGRAHRACAELCLRGGIPAVFVARDRRGNTAHLLITGADDQPLNAALLRWVGDPVEASGEIVRQGKWLVWRIDPASLRRPPRV
jgi:hypothetical protein